MPKKSAHRPHIYNWLCKEPCIFFSHDTNYSKYTVVTKAHKLELRHFAKEMDWDMVTRKWDLTLMLGDSKTIFLFLIEKEGIRKASLVYFFDLIHGKCGSLNMWPTVWKPEWALRHWADFKTDRPEAELIVRCVLAFLSLPYPLAVSLISTCAPTVWDFRHHVCESA